MLQRIIVVRVHLHGERARGEQHLDQDGEVRAFPGGGAGREASRGSANQLTGPVLAAHQKGAVLLHERPQRASGERAARDRIGLVRIPDLAVGLGELPEIGAKISRSPNTPARRWSQA